VCLVEGKDWVAAEQLVKLVPAGSTDRSDVAKAQQRLSAELQRRSAQTAAPTPSSPSAAKAAMPNARPAAPSPGPSATPPPAKDMLAESRRLVLAGKAGDATKELTVAVKADPGNRDLRLALLEAACLARTYETGAAQVAILTPFGDSEAPSKFYAAVVLYETGKTVEARGYLTEAMPRVSGPLVDEYSKKILGAQ
jgi:hypothetical protein